MGVVLYHQVCGNLLRNKRQLIQFYFQSLGTLAFGTQLPYEQLKSQGEALPVLPTNSQHQLPSQE